MVMIESIESRTLFAASVPQALIQLAEASSDPAIQAKLDVIKVEIEGIAEARGGSARDALRQVIEEGASRIVEARDALRGLRGADPAVRELAEQTLKSIRTELKTTFALAREHFRETMEDNRTWLRTLTASLRQHVRELRQDLRNAVGNPSATSGGPALNGTNIYTGGTTVSAGTLNLSSTVSSGTGALDLTDGSLVVKSSNLATIQSLVVTHNSDFTWQGPGFSGLIVADDRIFLTPTGIASHGIAFVGDDLGITPSSNG